MEKKLIGKRARYLAAHYCSPETANMTTKDDSSASQHSSSSQTLSQQLNREFRVSASVSSYSDCDLLEEIRNSGPHKLDDYEEYLKEVKKEEELDSDYSA